MGEHEYHLDQVLAVLHQHHLFANEKKRSFGQDSIEYLGHIVSGDGVSADPAKVEAMVHWPIPTNLKELRGFLGLTSYYRKFVTGYSHIAGPLINVLRKDNFHWDEAANNAFVALKQAMTRVPVLALLEFNKPFILETDASGYGVGAVLMQEKRPIAYFSQALSTLARNKSVYERELMAIVLAI